MITKNQEKSRKQIIMICIDDLDTKIRYVDSTPLKACANSRKYEKKLTKEKSMFFEDVLV